MRSWLLVLALLTACGKGAAAGDAAGAGGVGSAGAAGTGGTEPPSSVGTVMVDGCANLGIGSEACSYRYVYDGSTCASRACKKLMIYFSGGQESCPDLADANSYLAYYKARGYVAVCAMPFQTSQGSAQFPRNKEAPRIDVLVRAVTSDPNVLAGWSGEYLLFSGVSHGASGPVVAMATQDYDARPAWRGTRYTAACFNDGTYDAGGLLGFGFANQCRDATAVVPYSRNYDRYCTWPGKANGNLPATWPDPSTCSTPDSLADTLTNVSVGNFAIRDWRLAECGSSLDPCLQDVLPAASIEALCNRIAATSGYNCTFESFPKVSHIACGIDASSIGSCNAWFQGRLASQGLN